MKLQLLYQKVYFKSNEWKELVSFASSINKNVSIFLLSKNIFLSDLKQIKSKFLGECVIVEFSVVDFNLVFDFINKMHLKYALKFFLVGFLFNFDNKTYFLKIKQFKDYLSYFNFKKEKSLTLTSINTILSYELLKYLKLNEISFSISMSFFKKFIFNSNFSFYY